MTGSHSMSSKRVFRAPSATVAVIIAAVIAAGLLVDAGIRAGVGEMLLLAPWVLATLWLVYVVLFSSHIELDRSGVRVQNYLRRWHLPWGSVSEIDLKWQLVFTLGDGRRVKCFGGPVAGRPGRPSLRPQERGGTSGPPAIRELTLVREEWERAQEAGAPSGDVRRTWDYPLTFALFAIIVWAVVALIITRG